MKRRVSQITIAMVAVIALSACIVITGDSSDLAAAPPPPPAADEAL